MSATAGSQYATLAETSTNDCASLHRDVPRYLIWTPTHGATVGLGARWLPSMEESFGNTSRRNRKHTQPAFIPNEEPWRMFYPRFTTSHDLLFQRFNVTDRELESRIFTIARPGNTPLFCLEPELAASWQRLENTLGIAASYLIRRCSPPLPITQPPAFPKSLGYLSTHTQRDYAVRTAIKSRDAFTMLGAYLTFALSLWMEDVETGNPWRIPFEILRSRPEYSPSQAWLDLLAVTQVCDTNPGLRVGGFLDGRTSVWAFKIPAFLRAQIPVWVHWGLQRPTNAFRVNEVMLTHYLPKNKDIGLAKERSVHSEGLPIPYAESSGFPLPSSAPPPPVDLSWLSDGPDEYIVPSTPPPVHLASDTLVNEKEIAAPTPHPRSGQFKGETIEAFLRRKKDEEPDLEKRETLEGKQRRLARLELANKGQFFERARYFQWDSAPGGHFLRTRIKKSCAEDVFFDMEMDQRVYHSFLNEWDLCEFLGERREPYADFIGDDDGDDDPQEADLLPNELSLPVEPSAAFRDSALDAIPPIQAQAAKAVAPPGLMELLSSRFGFQGAAGYTPSLHLYPPDKGPRPPKAIEAATALGDKKFFNSEQGQVEWVEAAILDFANISITSVGPRNTPIDTAQLPPSFDTSPRAHYSRKAPLKTPLPGVDRVERCSLISRPGSCWTEERLVVAIKSPTTMLQLRRAEVTTPEEAVHFLLSRGITFNTARAWVRHAKPFPTEVSTDGLGFRTQGYTPDAAEYALYVDMRRRLLRGPAGRAALMKGGILWRLAKDTDSTIEEEVLRGPSDESRWFGQKLGNDCHEDCSIVDDDLHESECDIICGVYRVDMGRKQAPKHSSWWPKPAIWAESGFGIGQWTPDAEAWYQKRLGDIQSGSATLFGSSEWTSKLRFQARYAIRIRKKHEDMAANWLDNICLL